MPSALSCLADAQLVAEVKRLAARERVATADLVASLAEFDSRKLHLGEGYSSLYMYATQALGYSEDAAYSRITAARAALRFPSIIERLADGAVTLTAVRLLAPHLTADNHRELLDAASRKSKREVEEIVARVQPKPDVLSSVRKLPAPKAPTFVSSPLAAMMAPGTATTAPSPDLAQADRADGRWPAATSAPSPSLAQADHADNRERTATPATASGFAQADRADDRRRAALAGSTTSLPVLLVGSNVPTPCAPTPSPKARTVVAPLAPERYKVQFTVSAETHARLRRAQELLRHSIPDGDPAAIFEQALIVLVDKLERTKWAATKPRKRSDDRKRRGARAAMPAPERPVPTSALELVPEQAGSDNTQNGRCGKKAERLAPAAGRGRTRRIPAVVRRAVWQRCGGQCEFVGLTGRRCTERGFLEFHHIIPCADGGPATVQNLRLLCTGHHGRESERWFGKRPSANDS